MIAKIPFKKTPNCNQSGGWIKGLLIFIFWFTVTKILTKVNCMFLVNAYFTFLLTTHLVLSVVCLILKHRIKNEINQLMGMLLNKTVLMWSRHSMSGSHLSKKTETPRTLDLEVQNCIIQWEPGHVLFLPLHIHVCAAKACAHVDCECVCFAISIYVESSASWQDELYTS